jgi:hypothetical protein
LIQIKRGPDRRVGVVEEPQVRLLNQFDSVYSLAQAAAASGNSLASMIGRQLSKETLDYDPIYNGQSEWRLLTAIDHPHEPARCLVSGTGLTHLGSAKNRATMHEKPGGDLNDSMKMFRWGVEGGKPEPGKIGVAPEWFYKGNGSILRAHGEPLVVPTYAEDGGEEAEVAGIYLISADGQPLRIGLCVGNEFSDHRFEKKNYLNLAGSKIRTCALGPELVIDPLFESVAGRVSIQRGDETVWSKDIRTGETEMCHSVRNIEHHHFKFETHRRPGDVHAHYFGACALSFGDGIQLADGDVMEVRFDGFGRPLKNPLRVATASDSLVNVRSL